MTAVFRLGWRAFTHANEFSCPFNKPIIELNLYNLCHLFQVFILKHSSPKAQRGANYPYYFWLAFSLEEVLNVTYLIWNYFISFQLHGFVVQRGDVSKDTFILWYLCLATDWSEITMDHMKGSDCFLRMCMSLIGWYWRVVEWLGADWGMTTKEWCHHCNCMFCMFELIAQVQNTMRPLQEVFNYSLTCYKLVTH